MTAYFDADVLRRFEMQGEVRADCGIRQANDRHPVDPAESISWSTGSFYRIRGPGQPRTTRQSGLMGDLGIWDSLPIHPEFGD